MRKSILFCCVFLLAANTSHAAGMLMRVQQMKAQRQHRMTQEQYLQYQAYQEQQQGDQASQQAAAAAPTYQQTVEQRNQAIAQAIVNAHSQSVHNEGLSNQAAPSGQVPSPQPSSPAPSDPSQAQDTVDLAEVWKKLDKKSTVWPLIMDDQAKLLTVSEYLDRFRQEGVKINQPPLHYVQAIDQVTQANPPMLQRPFGELVQILAIVDYDFDNGMDKDVLARKVLGDAGFEANKKRFSQQAGQPH